ncbi:heme-binding protein 2 [Aulostomus maculatus]
MIYVSGLVVFLLMSTADARVGNSSEIPFCTETEECLLFNLVCENEHYEVRHYDAAKWVSTTEEAYFMDIAMMRAFRRLFRYISGDNDAMKKITMTSPVIVKRTETKFWQTGTFTISFLLPSKFQLVAPRPTDAKVYIHDLQAMNVYVRTYQGWMTGFSDNHNAKTLSDSLDLVDANYKKGFHYGAGYNSPWTMFNRHNEVWFVAEGEPACNSSEEMDS